MQEFYKSLNQYVQSQLSAIVEAMKQPEEERFFNPEEELASLAIYHEEVRLRELPDFSTLSQEKLEALREEQIQAGMTDSERRTLNWTAEDWAENAGDEAIDTHYEALQETDEDRLERAWNEALLSAIEAELQRRRREAEAPE